VALLGDHTDGVGLKPMPDLLLNFPKSRTYSNSHMLGWTFDGILWSHRLVTVPSYPSGTSDHSLLWTRLRRGVHTLATTATVAWPSLTWFFFNTFSCAFVTQKTLSRYWPLLPFSSPAFPPPLISKTVFKTQPLGFIRKASLCLSSI